MCTSQIHHDMFITTAVRSVVVLRDNPDLHYVKLYASRLCLPRDFIFTFFFFFYFVACIWQAKKHFNIRGRSHFEAEEKESELQERNQNIHFLPKVWESCQAHTLKLKKHRRWQGSWCLELAVCIHPLKERDIIFLTTRHSNKSINGATVGQGKHAILSKY